MRSNSRSCVIRKASHTLLSLTGLLLLAASQAVSAQEQPRAPRLDLAFLYTGERANPVAGQAGNFWLQGGGFEFGASIRHGFGLAANVTGTHAKSYGPNNIPLGLLSVTFGPRYRFTPRSHKISVFGEALIGEQNAFDTLIPDKYGLTNSGVSLATQVGGGLDLFLGKHFAIRPVEASWVRSQLPNATTNVQNDLRLGGGVAVLLRQKRRAPAN